MSEKVSQVLSQIEELHKKVQKIVQEKKILEIELQSKQKECQLLSKLVEKDVSLSSMVEKRESDLQSAQQEAGRCQKELLKVQAELKEKHKEVAQLKKDNEKLSCFYSIEKEQVSKLIQLTVDLRSDKQEVSTSCIS